MAAILCASICLGLSLLLAGVDALRIRDKGREFQNWTHIADFAFTAGGRIEGNVASSSPSSWLLLFEESLWLDMRLRRDPIISTCDAKAMASWALQIDSTGPRPKNVDFYVEEFGKYHAFIVDVSPSQCPETMFLLREWRKAKTRGVVRIFHRLFSNRFDHWHNHPQKNVIRPPPGLTSVKFDLHFVNERYGSLMEFSADEVMILPTMVAFIVAFVILMRFQLASTRLLWTNTGIAVSSSLLMIVASKLASICITVCGLLFFMFRGQEIHGSHDYKWGSVLLDGFFGLGNTLFLIFTSKGWMITTPSISLTSDREMLILLGALLIHSLANVFSIAELVLFDVTTVTMVNDHFGMLVEILLGCSHFYIFIATYADLVNLMLRSRRFVGAKIRGRVFSVIAALLLTWGLAPVIQISATHMFPYWIEPFAITFTTLLIQLFSSTLLAWTFRPEVLWELHGERPHIGAARLIMSANRKPTLATQLDDDDDDVADEMDRLLL